MQDMPLWGSWALRCLGALLLAGLALAIWRLIFRPIHSYFSGRKQEYTEDLSTGYDGAIEYRVSPAGEMFGCIASIFWLLGGLFIVLAVCSAIVAVYLFFYTIILVVQAGEFQVLAWGGGICAAIVVILVAVMILQWIVAVIKDLRSGSKKA